MTRLWAVGALASLLGAFAGEVANAGSYAHLVNCTQEVAGFCAQGTDVNDAAILPFAIVHPPGYDGTQSVVNVDVCVVVDLRYPDLTPYVASAIATWNALTPAIGNCGPVCILPEDPPVASGGLDLESVALHELAHALGLDHPNLRFRDPLVNAFVDTSFSAAYDGAAIGVLVGADGVRGSRDDFMDDLFGSTAVNVNWFRELDNDPFVIDSEIIDINHFSRATSNQLPAGSTWAANANRCHGFQLGHPATQSVMYSSLTEQAALVFAGGRTPRRPGSTSDRSDISSPPRTR